MTDFLAVLLYHLCATCLLYFNYVKQIGFAFVIAEVGFTTEMLGFWRGFYDVWILWKTFFSGWLHIPYHRIAAEIPSLINSNIPFPIYSTTTTTTSSPYPYSGSLSFRM